jgi:hypothetical protein
MASRKQNERRYPQWMDLPDGGRRYIRTITGRDTGFARYIKTVDANETTTSIIQEVYDDAGRLIGIHEKFPVDQGHIDIYGSEEQP